MPSHLRITSQFEPVAAHATYQTSTTQRPAKKQKMSLTQTYYVASTARSKLAREAGQADHDLRKLVAHANTLDALMVELQQAEREQEQWFNAAVRKASKPEEPRRVQWLDTVAEQFDEEESDDESDDGSDIDEDEFELVAPREDYHPLQRSPKQNLPSPPPELLSDDEESDSEDEEMPPSPENVVLQLSEKQRQAITTTGFYDDKDFAAIEESHQTTLIAAAC